MQNQPTAAILSVQNVSKSFGAQAVLRDVSLTVHEGDRIGLIGRNGAGKSTLLRVLSGLEVPDAGVVTRQQDLRIAVLHQQCGLDRGLTIGQVLDAAMDSVRDLLRRHEDALHMLADSPPDSPAHERAAEIAAHLQHEIEIADAWNLDKDIKLVETALNLPARNRALGELSAGELRRVDLAAAFIQRPDVLLLDEPTNHIDVESVRWIENFLVTYPGTCVLITHDRYFLDRVANRVVEIERGGLRAYAGNYERYLELKSVQQEYEARVESKRQAILRRELAWLRRGAKARTTKQKARIQRYDALDANGPPPAERAFDFTLPQSQRLGKRILEADQITLSVDERPLFRDFTLFVQKHMRIGIVGPNGAGKTTLLRVLMGEIEPDRGTIYRSDAVEFLYIDQTLEAINPRDTILKHVSNNVRELEVNGTRIHVPAYLEQFLFERASVNMPMENLSGGELKRIDLAKKLLCGGNILVFDEPTNDLDLPTLRVLEEIVEDFDGPALLVSHDRYFLNRLCTDMLVFEAEGRIVHVAGNYDDYLVYAAKRDEARRDDSPSTKATMPKRTQPASRKMTWQDKREYESIEATVSEAESEVARLEALVSEPQFYRGSSEAIRETLAALDSARDTVDRLYHRWQELETLAGD